VTVKYSEFPHKRDSVLNGIEPLKPLKPLFSNDFLDFHLVLSWVTTSDHPKFRADKIVYQF